MLVRLDRGAVVSQLRAMRGPRLAGQRHWSARTGERGCGVRR